MIKRIFREFIITLSVTALTTAVLAALIGVIAFGVKFFQSLKQEDTPPVPASVSVSVPETVLSDDNDYIGNKNTHKLHEPTCVSIAQMKEENKEYLHCSREAALEQGYQPCRLCSP